MLPVLRFNRILFYGFGAKPLLVRICAEAISKNTIETKH